MTITLDLQEMRDAIIGATRAVSDDTTRTISSLAITVPDTTRVEITGTNGHWLENAIQAMCRDLLCDALLRAEAAGLNPVLHVHDEIVCDVPRDATGGGK